MRLLLIKWLKSSGNGNFEWKILKKAKAKANVKPICYYEFLILESLLKAVKILQFRTDN